ncbi:MAG: benzoyl-CoA-dihydrodiol lyase [Planctomycetes bacterium]|nr:benzoyl-CoA-dihydrodiol lyase [Planctomycetota bacterium]
MDQSPNTITEPVDVARDPSSYTHWKVEFDGPIARVRMEVQQHQGLRSGYELKLNSYDLGVDLELADIVRRLRFEHPEVCCLVVTSGHHQAFCSGANIHMLGQSTHGWKVNFCKFTNETRCELESLSRGGDFRSICAVNGPCAGGGYELAMACDEIWLVDDGNSAVSLPEVPLLGVLPGTGGLTRLVDKRKVRRDRADVFCTVAEGIKGKRAVKWGLVDHVAPRSKFDEKVDARASEIVDQHAAGRTDRRGIELTPLKLEASENERRYSSVTITHHPDRRVADFTIEVPPVSEAPADAAAAHAQGADFWPLRAWREIENAILDLRLNHRDTGLVLLRAKGSLDDSRAWDQFLLDHRGHWFIDETIAFMAVVARRLELTAVSLFALADEGTCFAGSLLELALACDRIYMLDEDGVEIARTPFNEGLMPMTNGISRIECRLPAEPDLVEEQRGDFEPKNAEEADELGLVTEAMDEIDFEDTVRIAIEERVSLSPDSLTGMEANLRFAGPETMDSKIFGRLTAWQNWIFIRPNATGPQGALTLYGKPERPSFDFGRV